MRFITRFLLTGTKNDRKSTRIPTKSYIIRKQNHDNLIYTGETMPITDTE